MKLLLDTHIWMWLDLEPERLSPSVGRLLVSTGAELYLSAGSAWEIAIKYALGKLPLSKPPAVYVPDSMNKHRILPLSVEHRHALAVATLPLHHHDPFDRVLIAQAAVDQLTIVTLDRLFKRYDVDVIWADRALRR